MSAEMHADAVERIYDGAFAGSAWDIAQAVLTERTGAGGFIFSALDDSVNAIASDALEETNRLYRERWWRDDVFLANALAQLPRPGLILDSHFDDRIDRDTHAFFRDFLRPQGWGRFAAFFSATMFGTRFMLMAARRLEDGPFAAGETAALASLAPHVVRALAVAGQATIARSREGALLSFLDRISYGAMILGSDGRVGASNAAAGRMLGDGLAVQDARLVEGFTNPRGTIDRLVRAAFAGEPQHAAGTLIHRPSGRKPIVVQAFGFPGPLPWTIRASGDAVLLMLIDTDEGEGGASKAAVMHSFGLTIAEARVAELVGAGFSPAEAAVQLGSAPGTVRTQLKNVFNKLDINRQTELVRLMTKLEVLGR